jgi:hypothetical protein
MAAALAASDQSRCSARPRRQAVVSASAQRKVDAFFDTQAPVLVVDELVNKHSEVDVRYLLLQLLRRGQHVQVARFQGTEPLQRKKILGLLRKCLRKGHIWALNVGEINLKRSRLAAFKRVLKESSVTHMFYECKNCHDEDKAEMRAAIRDNRVKHGRWDKTAEGQAEIVAQCRKCWFNPGNHKVTWAQHVAKVNADEQAQQRGVVVAGGARVHHGVVEQHAAAAAAGGGRIRIRLRLDESGGYHTVVVATAVAVRQH